MPTVWVLDVKPGDRGPPILQFLDRRSTFQNGIHLMGELIRDTDSIQGKPPNILLKQTCITFLR